MRPVITQRRLASRKGERGFLTLIGLLVVIVIIGIMLAMYAGPSGKGGGSGGAGGGTVLGGSVRQARSTVCRNNLSQFRQAVQVEVNLTGAYPVSLEALQLGLPASCPGGDEPYDYDPTTGQIQCVHPGHERY